MSPENDLDALVESLLEKVPEKDRDLASKWILRKRSEGKTVNSIRTYLNAIATLSKMSPGKAITESDTEDVLNLQVKVREKYRSPVLYCHVLRDFLKKGGREDLGVLVSLNSKKSKKEVSTTTRSYLGCCGASLPMRMTPINPKLMSIPWGPQSI